MLCLNVRSILDINRRIALSNAILQTDYDILCLTETWLVKEIPDKALHLAGFNIIRKDRKNSTLKTNHGGVLMAIKENVHYEEIDAQIENEECIVAKLTGETGHHQILCCVYNPPKNSKYQWKQQNFINLFENLTKLQIQHNCNAVSITGDINFEYTHWKMMHSKDKYENAVLKKLIELDYEQLFDSKKKQLDVLLTNNPGVILNWHTDHSATNAYSIDKVSCSDHYAYSATINMEASIKEINKDESLAFNRADWKIINQEIKDKPFIPYCYSNVNELLRQWYAWLWDKIKNNVPKVTSHRSTLPPWVKPSTSHMLKRVQTLKRCIDRQNKPNLSIILKHKKLEKNLQIALTADQAIYEETVTSSRRFSDLQKYLNKISSSRKYPQKMFYKEKSTRDDTQKATFFNEFFISVYQKESIPNPLARNTNCSPTEEICTQIHIEETKIQYILKNLLTNKASGFDGIGNIILKNLSETLSKSLYLLFRTFINKRLFPTYWKTSQVAPIFKEKNKASVECYRPISLLCSASKVFEKIIFDNIYPKVQPFLENAQYGFRQKRSAVLQMVQFLSKVYELYDDKNVQTLSVLYLDFSKAFDKVPHSILVAKLRNIGLSIQIQDIIQDYLTDRMQFVKINKSSSTLKEVTSGVPQGSILGPLLFIIFINDFPKCIENSDCFGYCDDMKILSTEEIHLQKDTANVEKWCKENKMPLNEDKCNLLNLKGKMEVTLFNTNVDTAKTQKDLGILMCHNLSWSVNAENRISKAMGAFYKIKRNISKKTSLKSKLNLYCGYIVPIISYASQTWYPNKAELRQLERVQKRATSWITNNFKMSYTERLKFLKLLPLSMYFELHDILYLVSLLKNKHDIDLNTIIHKNESRTRQATRGEIAVHATRLKKSN